MLGAERDGEGNLREVSVEFVAVEFVAVAQQHAEQKDGNMQNNKRMATCRTTKRAPQVFPAALLLIDIVRAISRRALP